MNEIAVAGTGRRRDRKAQIAEAAASLFCEVGYHRVGIDDVAREVGITGGAIYRHFANKSELLARTLRDGTELLAAAIAAATDEQHLWETLATHALDNRGFGILLQREARHLGPADRADIFGRLDAATDALGDHVRRARPDVRADDGWLLARSVLSALASPSYHSVAVPRSRAEELLGAMATAIAGTGAVPAPSRPPRRERGPERANAAPPARRTSRREQLLAAAIQLFGSRGYWPVRMEDIGAAAGITGPSIYSYFPGKADLLLAALNRGAEWLQLGMAQALATGSSAKDALERVIDSYVRFVLDHPDLISLLLTESVYLPVEKRHALRRTQHDYVAEWSSLLVQVRPELTEQEARFLTHGVFGIVNDGGRSSRVHDGWDAEAVLGRIGRDVLFGSQW